MAKQKNKKFISKLIIVILSLVALIGTFAMLIVILFNIEKQDIIDTAISKGAPYEIISQKDKDELKQLNKILPEKDDLNDIDLSNSYVICFYKYTCSDCHTIFEDFKTPEQIKRDFSGVKAPNLYFIPVNERKDGSAYFYINQELTDVFKVEFVPSITIYDKNANSYTTKSIYTKTNEDETVLDYSNYNEMKNLYKKL